MIGGAYAARPGPGTATGAVAGRGGAGLVEFAPSLAWLSLMVLPLWYQFPVLHPFARNLQLGTVSAIALLLLLADLLALRLGAARRPGAGSGRAAGSVLLIGACFVLPILAHFYLMPHYPLLALLTNDDATYQEMMRLRDASAKFLDVPSMLKYVFNWAFMVFAPLFIAVSVCRGRRMQALAGFLFAGLYATVSLAKLPLVLLCLSCVFALSVAPWRGRVGLRWALVAGAAAGWLSIGLLLGIGGLKMFGSDFVRGQPAGLAQMHADDPRRAMTYGDNFRLPEQPGAEPGSTLTRAAEYLVYRVWLTPSDVSNRWYQYYTYATGERLGLRFLVPGPRTATTDTPSRLVGVWAYQSRFPDRYTSTISANASFDADAFAHAGLGGVALATVLLLGVRVGAAWLLTEHPVALAAYGVMLCLLSVLPASASLQAIFGANGLAIVPVLLLALRVPATWRWRRASVAPP